MDAARTHDSEEAAHLLATGGRLRRLAHDMVVDLTTAEAARPYAAPAGVLLEALDCHADDIAAAHASAMTSSHVDFAIWSGMDRAEYWKRLLNGEGPSGSILAEPSGLLRGAADRIVGAVVVTAMEAAEWWAGDPWLPELFIVSDLQEQGLGGLLLGHALGACARGGYKRLGLTVTEGNPARHLYERFGFQPFRATWFIELPARPSE